MSIRPSESQLARVLEYAKRRGVTTHAAVLELVEMGLGGKEQAAKPAPVKPFATARVETPKAAIHVNVPLASKAPAPYGSRLKKR